YQIWLLLFRTALALARSGTRCGKAGCKPTPNLLEIGATEWGEPAGIGLRLVCQIVIAPRAAVIGSVRVVALDLLLPLLRSMHDPIEMDHECIFRRIKTYYAVAIKARRVPLTSESHACRPVHSILAMQVRRMVNMMHDLTLGRYC